MPADAERSAWIVERDDQSVKTARTERREHLPRLAAHVRVFEQAERAVEVR